MDRAKEQGGLFSVLTQVLAGLEVAATFVFMMTIPTIPNEAPLSARLQPAW
jgi:hypothetical protein